jgi:hypothetical protein
MALNKLIKDLHNQKRNISVGMLRICHFLLEKEVNYHYQTNFLCLSVYAMTVLDLYLLNNLPCLQQFRRSLRNQTLLRWAALLRSFCLTEVPIYPLHSVHNGVQPYKQVLDGL